jgi:ATP-dependent exoDNAse (exonuclease V) alpha subunit
MAGLLESAGVKFETGRDIKFDGTTIVSKNIEVDRFNGEALNRVVGRLIGLPSRRWGKLRTEWNNIPDKTIIRENAYVMLLANLSDGAGGFEYVNGDCGHIRGITMSTVKGQPPTVQVELVRNNMVVNVRPLVRGVEFKDKPDGMTVEHSVPASDDFGYYIPRPHYRGKTRRYVTGQIEYYPIRLAYASTVHKSQGLSLDKCQIDVNDWSFSNAGMVYVALSRCRTMEGLRLVGAKEKFAERCRVDAKVRNWL